MRERLSRFFWSGLDLDVIWILAFPSVLALLLPGLWTLGLAALFPQGRIYVRVAWDYPGMNRSPFSYLVVNESIVAVTIAGIWLFNGLAHGQA